MFEGVFIPGPLPGDVVGLCERLHLAEDLAGKRVLDIGGWHGCFSFECERRGAEEVVCFSLENPHASGFHRIKTLLGSKVRYVQGSVYTLPTEELGQFDIALFLGVLYHLRYPLLAVDKLRRVCRGEVYIETNVIDECFITREPGSNVDTAGPLPEGLRAIPIWRQYAAYELHPEDASNWFGPNNRAVIEAFESAGFEVEDLGTTQDRGHFRGRVLADVPERLKSGTYESRDAHDAEVIGVSENYGDLFEPMVLPAVSPPRDTRRMEGVRGRLEVRLETTRLVLGETLRGRAVAENTGMAVWLPSTAGVGGVRLGVRLYDGEGVYVQDLPGFAVSEREPVRPGERIEFDFEISASMQGRWDLDFDLVADGVGWFQFRTDMPRRFAVEVS